MEKDINQLIEKFIEEIGKDFNVLKYAYNNSKFIEGETPVYYSGPYWNSQEITAAIKSLIVVAPT